MTRVQLVCLFGAVAIFCLLQGLFWSARGRRRRREDLLRARLRGADPGAAVKVTREAHGELGGLEKIALARRIGATLVQGGFGLSLRAFLLRAVAAVVMTGVGFGLLTQSLLNFFVFAGIAVVAVHFYTVVRRNRRLRTIDIQLPKALELMVFGLRAGHSLEDTIKFAGNELMPPLSEELKRCVEEYELGRPIEEALLGLSLRLEPCRALRTFVEAVLVLKQTGGNLIDIIDQIIDSLRAQAAYEAKFRALTAEGRTSGLILGAVPLLVLAAVVLVQPDYLATLLTDPAGWKVIGLASGLWLAGVLWLARLARPAAA
jgi:tight adherence protein B